LLKQFQVFLLSFHQNEKTNCEHQPEKHGTPPEINNSKMSKIRKSNLFQQHFLSQLLEKPILFTLIESMKSRIFYGMMEKSDLSTTE
jgi:hypothetical protein